MKFAIVTDTCTNLEEATLKELNIEVARTHYMIDNKDYLTNNDWTDVSPEEFYKHVRAGEKIYTSQADSHQFKEIYERVLKETNDILVICVGKAFSSTIDEAGRAKDEVLKEYPNARIEILDSYGATYSFGMLVMECARLRDEGKSFEEVLNYALEDRTSYLECGYCDELKYLKRAGRINAAAAFFGTLIGIKPMIIYDETGHNTAIEKLKGRKAANKRCAEIIKEYGILDKFNTIYVAHSNSKQLADEVIEAIKEELNNPNVKFHVGEITQVIGSSVGPGTIIIGFYGNKELRKLATK